MVGANVVMVTSALYKKGIDYLGELTLALNQWLDDHDHPNLDKLRGCMSETAVSNPVAFARANYMEVLQAHHDQGKTSA